MVPVNRGTPECPGLVFGLDRGGSCRGVAYRLAGDQVPDYFPALWDREMSTGAYLPRWINCSTEAGQVRALVFVMNRDNPAYIRALPEPELLAIVRRASGRYGPCTEYVVQTAQARAAGIHDSRLDAIARRLKPTATRCRDGLTAARTRRRDAIRQQAPDRPAPACARYEQALRRVNRGAPAGRYKLPVINAESKSHVRLRSASKLRKERLAGKPGQRFAAGTVFPLVRRGPGRQGARTMP